MPAPRRPALPQEQQQPPAAGTAAPALTWPLPHSSRHRDHRRLSCSQHLAPPRERRHSLGDDDEGTEDVTELLLLYIQFPT